MNQRLFVANLKYAIDDARLREVFEERGYEVVEARVIVDKARGQSKGFGFVEVVTDKSMQDVIADMDETSVDGRAIRVAEAKQEQRRARTGGGGGGERSQHDRRGGGGGGGGRGHDRRGGHRHRGGGAGYGDDPSY